MWISAKENEKGHQPDGEGHKAIHLPGVVPPFPLSWAPKLATSTWPADKEKAKAVDCGGRPPPPQLKYRPFLGFTLNLLSILSLSCLLPQSKRPTIKMRRLGSRDPVHSTTPSYRSPTFLVRPRQSSKVSMVMHNETKHLATNSHTPEPK